MLQLRLEEHNNPMKKSQHAKDLKYNINRVFNWVILWKAPQNYKVRRNLDA